MCACVQQHPSFAHVNCGDVFTKIHCDSDVSTVAENIPRRSLLVGVRSIREGYPMVSNGPLGGPYPFILSFFFKTGCFHQNSRNSFEQSLNFQINWPQKEDFCLMKWQI